MDQELETLIRFVEENTRADKVSGIEFIDPRNFKNRVKSKQNYVVFGRRGAGKSTLLKTLKSTPSSITIYVNLEDFKDITFPNIIIKVLMTFYTGLISDLNKNKSIKDFIRYIKTNRYIKQIKNC